MTRFLRGVTTIAVSAAVATAGLLAVGAPANADATTAVGTAKVAVVKRIDMRLAALARFDATVTSSRHMADAHRSTLHSLISQDTSGLTALRTKVNGETTLAALKADAISMVTEFRVYMLVGPKVRLTSAGDAEKDAIGRLNAAYDNLSGLVAKAKAKGANTATAEQNLADMKASVTKADSEINGQVGTLLALQPSPDGATLTSKVDGVRAALVSGRGDLVAAVAKAKAVRDFLKGLSGTGTTK